VTVGQELAERLSLRLDQAEREKLVKHADEKVIGHTPWRGFG
jgi:hypothetical protein